MGVEEVPESGATHNSFDRRMEAKAATLVPGVTASPFS